MTSLVDQLRLIALKLELKDAELLAYVATLVEKHKLEEKENREAVWQEKERLLRVLVQLRTQSK